jgi:carbonic anhydrase/acetyltransferase-like protein (isoleucine patch superfamily)
LHEETQMTVYALGPDQPMVDEQAWVAPNAQVVGRVSLAAGATVWFGAVLRGDNEPIAIGAGSNVQENAVLHTDRGFPLAVGESVTVGHQAMLHGCTIGDGALIGMQAVVLNGAVIGRECLVGAGALVTAGKVFAERSLIVGSPARVLRALTDEEVAGLRRAAQDYVDKGRVFRESLRVVAPAP